MTNPYRSPWMTEELDAFRDQFRRFLAKELAPHAEKWRQDKIVGRAAWRALGDIGALLPSVPEVYGGQGTSFAYDAAVIEDLEAVVSELATGYSVHSTIAALTSCATAPKNRSSAGCQSSRPVSGSVRSR